MTTAAAWLGAGCNYRCRRVAQVAGQPGSQSDKRFLVIRQDCIMNRKRFPLSGSSQRLLRDYELSQTSWASPPGWQATWATPRSTYDGKDMLMQSHEHATPPAWDVIKGFGSGIVTGAKGIVNGAWNAGVSTVTLGQRDGNGLLHMSEWERTRGGGGLSEGFAQAGSEILIGVGTGGTASALSKGGKVARAGSYAIRDTMRQEMSSTRRKGFKMLAKMDSTGKMDYESQVGPAASQAISAISFRAEHFEVQMARIVQRTLQNVQQRDQKRISVKAANLMATFIRTNPTPQQVPLRSLHLLISMATF